MGDDDSDSNIKHLVSQTGNFIVDKVVAHVLICDIYYHRHDTKFFLSVLILLAVAFDIIE
jgi:hypothetical protein